MKFTTSVVKGHGRGKMLGFPTFNLVIPHELTIKFGVYACTVWIDNNQYRGALHFGPVPTFKEAEPSLEIFVLDYNSDNSLNSISFELGKFIRDIKAFSSEEDLVTQIAGDVAVIHQST